MNQHFLDFKKAFNQHTAQMHFTNKHLFSKLKQTTSENWIKIFSAGLIIYSGYYYFKRTNTSKINCPHHFSVVSYFYSIKKLFSRKFLNASTETEKNNILLTLKEIPEYVKYDSGWYNELDELKQSLNLENTPVPVTAKNSALEPLRETTPRGEIIMYYDSETKSFNYYSNSKNIPYSTLDAVARKYVCFHKNPSIYIDIRDEVQKGRDKCLKQEQKDKHLKLERIERNKNKNGNADKSGILFSAKKSLFAAFKNYKTGKNAPKSLYDGKKETVIIKDNINKFVYKGTLKQYDADLKHKKHCEYIKDTTDFTDSSENVKNNLEDNNNLQNQNHNNLEDVKLNHEKQHLSYSEFKQKLK